MNWPWNELGLPGPAELSEIRRAYSRRLKDAHPEENPEAFQSLNQAYQEARRLVQMGIVKPNQNADTPPKSKPDSQNLIFFDDYFDPSKRERVDAEESHSQNSWDFDQLLDNEDEDDSLFDPLDPDTLDALFDFSSQDESEEKQDHSGSQDWDFERILSEEADGDAERELQSLLDQMEERRKLHEFSSFESGQEDGWEETASSQKAKKRRRSSNRSRKAISRIRIRKIPAVILIFLLIIIARILWANSIGVEPWQNKVCEYLEEDFGQSFHGLKDGDTGRALFLPDNDDTLYFQALETGERNPEEGKPGYETNYPDMLLQRKLEEFTAAQNLDFTVSSRDRVLGVGETSGIYLLDLPLTGAGESIEALGECLSACKQEAWYQQCPPVYQIFLCYKGMSFYDILSTRDEFDGKEVREQYEKTLGSSLCSYFADKIGLPQAAFGGNNYVMANQEGTIKAAGQTFFWVRVLEKSPPNNVLADYLLSESGLIMFCLKPGDLESDPSFAYLYSGTMATYRVEEMNTTVRVWNQFSLAP